MKRHAKTILLGSSLLIGAVAGAVVFPNTVGAHPSRAVANKVVSVSNVRAVNAATHPNAASRTLLQRANGSGSNALHVATFSGAARMGAHASRNGTGHSSMYTRNATGAGTHTCTHMGTGTRTGK
jgi:hypothetical protein